MMKTFKPKKCKCGLIPEVKIDFKKCNSIYDVYVECKCGLRTDLYSMPWIAVENWNNNNFIESQMSLFL